MFIWPVPGYYTITSGYADRRSYGIHGAIDIAAPTVPTVALDYGTVVFVGWAGSAGRSIYIDLDNGYRAHYCHLSDFRGLFVGKWVTPGSEIGYVGGSGHGVDNYYGSHLHLNLVAPTQPATGPSHWVAWVGMWAVDPEIYLLKEDDMATLQEVEAAIQELRADATSSDSKLRTDLAKLREDATASDKAIRAKLDALTAGTTSYTDVRAVAAVKRWLKRVAS